MDWRFWIDRGGTFTDVVAQAEDGTRTTLKLLSENPEQYTDAALAGIRRSFNLSADMPIPTEKILEVKMGTTVATNALLERRGEPTALCITQGFADQLQIANQNRPDIFARHIALPQMLYRQVVEISERVDCRGQILTKLNIDKVQHQLSELYQTGIRAIAVVLMHSYRYPEHEKLIGDIAKQIGFSQISLSHDVSPIRKIVSRGHTTVVDAYLSPVIHRYINDIAKQLGGRRLYFMQSNGGLSEAQHFRGKNSIFSGPAAGVVGAVEVCKQAGLNNIICFDMGGTSTDVTLFHGQYQRRYDTIFDGIPIHAPMMDILTIAAGGGSVVEFRGGRYQVGPDSAGANPGPAAYRRGGPLTITDCNVLLGRIQAEFFPSVFGVNANQGLDVKAVREKFNTLTKTPEQMAQGFLTVAVHNMANAIKKISLQRGYDIRDYALCCFGGAGGQHACQVADVLGIEKILIPANAGVLSALGMGMADLRIVKEQSLGDELSDASYNKINSLLNNLEKQGHNEILAQQPSALDIQTSKTVRLKYFGTDVPLTIPLATLSQMQKSFTDNYQQLYGFSQSDTAIIIDSIAVEVIGKESCKQNIVINPSNHAKNLLPIKHVNCYIDDSYQKIPLYLQQDFCTGKVINGPAIIAHADSTTFIAPNWMASITKHHHVNLTRIESAKLKKIGSHADPVMLELFNNLFVSIAEQMGTALERTAYSVNIKERLDFSCALFNTQGDLIANAQHIPVHLGSMSESVKSIIQARGDTIKAGDVFMLNSPYHGGTHLPDVTVITPVFINGFEIPTFFVASRAHQADIGGITPGSVPAMSTHIDEEGILINDFHLVSGGALNLSELETLLTTGDYPVRNFHQNLADLKAQIAANQKGVIELQQLVENYGLETVNAYMQFVQDNAEENVRQVIEHLSDGTFEYAMDNNSHISVTISIDKQQRKAIIDFTGTSAQQENNFNAPIAVVRAAVLYVFRTLINENIPMNQGFFKPLEIIIPDNCLLNPKYPAAVVAGNVETSQAIVDTLYGALNIMAASQGTMNNFTFGNERYQYYETICGGTGAGPDFNGTDAVHSHMTNTRLTDPEVLEARFPVLVESFSIRKNSGGLGKHNGGNGVRRKLRFLVPMTASILSNHRVVPPYGLAGGAPGKAGKNRIQRADGTIEDLNSTACVELLSGDSFIIETPGGGGYGQ